MDSQRTTRVLVVEDEQDLADIYQRHLNRLGCEVRLASTGKAALDVAADFHPDLAFVDTMLPDMLGTSVVEGLRDRSPHCLVVVASGLDLDVQDTHGDAVMPKPFSGNDIANIMDWYSGQHFDDETPVPGTAEEPAPARIKGDPAAGGAG